MAAESGEKFQLGGKDSPTDCSNGPRPRRWPTDPISCNHPFRPIKNINYGLKFLGGNPRNHLNEAWARFELTDAILKMTRPKKGFQTLRSEDLGT